RPPYASPRNREHSRIDWPVDGRRAIGCGARKVRRPQVKRQPRKRLVWQPALAVAAALLLLWFAAPGYTPIEGEHIGVWSLLPAMTTLILVFLTREVVSSLFAGVLVGGLVS